MKKSQVKTQKPKVVIVMGGVSSGKTTYIKNEYSENYTYIDAGEIFIELSKGDYFDFPSHLESVMNNIGLNKLRTAFKNREDIVVELVGQHLEGLKELLELISKVDYESFVINLTCTIDEANDRNENRSDDAISSYYCEPYHLNWFRQIIPELVNN